METKEGSNKPAAKKPAEKKPIAEKPEVKKPEVKKPKPKPAAKKDKGPTDDQILEAYDKLEFLLAEKTSVEKLKNMPFKFYFVHFRQVSRLKKQFERTRRT